jgi:hypothetical protein
MNCMTTSTPITIRTLERTRMTSISAQGSKYVAWTVDASAVLYTFARDHMIARPRLLNALAASLLRRRRGDGNHNPIHLRNWRASFFKHFWKLNKTIHLCPDKMIIWFKKMSFLFSFFALHSS